MSYRPNPEPVAWPGWLAAVRSIAAADTSSAYAVARHISLRQAPGETGAAFVRRITLAMLDEMGGGA